MKGFGGGFGRRALAPWGEAIVKQFVREAVDETLKLESALARLRTEHRVALLHYAPIRETIEGEPADIHAFLGSSRLEEPLGRYPVSFVVHGHAHCGCLEGATKGGFLCTTCRCPCSCAGFRIARLRSSKCMSAIPARPPHAPHLRRRFPSPDIVPKPAPLADASPSVRTAVTELDQRGPMPVGACARGELRSATAFYTDVLTRLSGTGIPFLVGGGFAFALYSGIDRRRIIVVQPADVSTYKLLDAVGYEDELPFPHWLRSRFARAPTSSTSFSPQADGITRVKSIYRWNTPQSNAFWSHGGTVPAGGDDLVQGVRAGA